MFLFLFVCQADNNHLICFLRAVIFELLKSAQQHAKHSPIPEKEQEQKLLNQNIYWKMLTMFVSQEY